MEDVAKSPFVGAGRGHSIFVETQTDLQLAARGLVDGPCGCRCVVRLLVLCRGVGGVTQTYVERGHRSIQPIQPPMQPIQPPMLVADPPTNPTTEPADPAEPTINPFADPATDPTDQDRSKYRSSRFNNNN